MVVDFGMKVAYICAQSLVAQLALLSVPMKTSRFKSTLPELLNYKKKK